MKKIFIIIIALFSLSHLYALSYYQEVMTDSPVSYWRFAETSGTTLINSGSSASSGTYYSAPTFGVTGALQGDSNPAIRINSAANYATVPGFSVGIDYTVEVWINMVSLSNHGRHYIIDMRNGGGPWFFIDQVNSSVGEINVRGASGSGDSIFYPTATLANSQWHHLAFTTGSFGTRLYLDGQEIASSTIRAAAGFGSGGRIGTYINSPSTDTDHWFHGSMDELAIYNGALSSSRILAHYNAAIAVPEPAALCLILMGLIFAKAFHSFKIR